MPPYKVIQKLYSKNLYTTSSRRAYTQELIGAAVGLNSSSEALLCDCKAVVGLSSSYKANNPLQDIIRQKGFNRLHHINGHPEKKGLRQLWTPGEHAIYEADQLASGPSPIDPPPLTHSEINAIVFSSSTQWHLIRAGQIYLGPIALDQQSHLLETYLVNRNTRYNTNLWNTSNFTFAITAQKTTRAQRGALQKLHLKRFDRDRKFSNLTLPRCHCGCKDILEDWTTICTHAPMVANRHIGLHNIANYLQHHPQLQFINQHLRTPTTLWRGIWPDNQQQQINAIADLQPTNSPLIKQAVRGLTALIMNTSLQLYHTRTDPVALKKESASSLYTTYLHDKLSKKQKRKFQQVQIPNSSSHMIQTPITAFLSRNNLPTTRHTLSADKNHTYPSSSIKRSSFSTDTTNLNFSINQLKRIRTRDNFLDATKSRSQAKLNPKTSKRPHPPKSTTDSFLGRPIETHSHTNESLDNDRHLPSSSSTSIRRPNPPQDMPPDSQLSIVTQQITTAEFLQNLVDQGIAPKHLFRTLTRTDPPSTPAPTNTRNQVSEVKEGSRPIPITSGSSRTYQHRKNPLSISESSSTVSNPTPVYSSSISNTSRVFPTGDSTIIDRQPTATATTRKSKNPHNLPSDSNPSINQQSSTADFLQNLVDQGLAPRHIFRTLTRRDPPPDATPNISFPLVGEEREGHRSPTPQPENSEAPHSRNSTTMANDSLNNVTNSMHVHSSNIVDFSSNGESFS